MAKRNPKGIQNLDPLSNQSSSLGRSPRLNHPPIADDSPTFKKKKKTDFKILEPIATLESNQIVVYDDDDMDEDLNAEVDKLCEVIMDYIFPRRVCTLKDLNLYRIQRFPPDAQISCSRFLAFCKQHKSKFDKFMERYSRVGIYSKKDVLPDNTHGTFPLPLHDDESVIKMCEEFKRFAIVKDPSDHLFLNYPIVKEPAGGWADHVRATWKDLEENLPETISVRAYEDRMDLLTAVIVGPKGTPYHDGLFFFDMFLPWDYPIHPPVVRYRSFGFGINPHLFECGEVRLVIIRASVAHFSSPWKYGVSRMVMFLKSIQDRFLNAEPLFHQPVTVKFGPSVVAEYFSLLYNEDILIKSLKQMIHIMNKPPKHFEAYVVGHFRDRMTDILLACRAYKEGLQVGGGVGNKDSCCSTEFRHTVGTFIWQLAYCFDEKIRVNKAGLFQALVGPIPPDR